MNVVPLLARLVLAAVFVVAGWNKLMTEYTFTGEEAAVLRGAGVTGGAPSSSGPVADGTEATGASEAGDAPLAGPISTRSLHHITVLAHRRDIPYAHVLGWLTAITELVGGALLIPGIFSRVWGLALAVIMGVAFAVTSLPLLEQASPFALSPDQLHQVAAQMALFVLATGILLVGPGAASIDRAIFRRSAADLD